MAKIGFLGLGEMGTPMASRLLHAGHDVVVWNRTVERTATLAQQGATVAPSPAKAAAGADFVITMLVANLALGAAIVALGEALSLGESLELKQARANRAWLDKAADLGAADLDFSAVVATIGGEEYWR